MEKTKVIREKRLKLGMTQEELAEKSGVSRATIVGLERGQTEITTTKTLEKLAKVLNCKIADFL